MVNKYRWRCSNIIEVTILFGPLFEPVSLASFLHPAWGNVCAFDGNGLPVGRQTTALLFPTILTGFESTQIQLESELRWPFYC